LSELSFDPRSEIRQSALKVLFETLCNHGHLFSLPLWERVFESVLFPIFDYVLHAIDPSGSSTSEVNEVETDGQLDQDAWLYETCTLALQLVVDLFVNFYNTINPLLRKVLMLLVSFIKRPHQSLAGIEAANATLPNFSFLGSGNFVTVNHEHASMAEDDRDPAESGSHDNLESPRTQNLYAYLSDAKCRASVQLLLIQAVLEIYNMYRSQLSAKTILVLFEALHDVSLHAHKINSNIILRSKLQEFGSMTQMQDPPLLRLENA
ncbi:Brefeldin A-inhibited guanine nucleotide-exchange protein 2, partial [Glycine soja]